MEVLQFNNLEVVIERKAFRRNLSVYVYPDRPVTVRASRLTSQKLILDFLALKKDWIEKHYTRVLTQKKKCPERYIRNQETFPFRGHQLILKPVITLQNKYFFSKTDTEILLHIPRNEWSQKVLVDDYSYLYEKFRQFYKTESISYLSSRVESIAKRTGLCPRHLRWSEPKTRWGSCSSAGSVQLNWRIIVFSDDIIDYIIVHELTHLKHLNHSKQFWNSVAQVLPDYKLRIKNLKETQMMSDFLNFSKAARTQDLSNVG